MREKLGYQPPLDRKVSKPNFFYRISHQFPLKENPELGLAASILSRMRGVSFEEKRHVLIYWAWTENPKKPLTFGLIENDIQQSIATVYESPFLDFMCDTLDALMASQQEKRAPKLPSVFEIKGMYFRSLLAAHLKEVTPDGKPLGYKEIARRMTRELGEPVNEERVAYNVRPILENGKVPRRHINKEQLGQLMKRVKILREQKKPKLSTREIAAKLNRSKAQVGLAIEYLLKGGEIERRTPGPLTHPTREALEKKLLQYTEEHPGQPVNLSALAREMGLCRRTVSEHYQKIAAVQKVPPTRTVS